MAGRELFSDLTDDEKYASVNVEGRRGTVSLLADEPTPVELAFQVSTRPMARVPSFLPQEQEAIGSEANMQQEEG